MAPYWLDEKVADPLTRSIGSLHRSARDRFYASRVYQASLSGRHPNHLVIYPHNPIPGERALADPMFEGRFTIGGVTIDASKAPPWEIPGVTESWLAEWHGFGWLRHFAAVGGEIGKRHARGFVKSWLQRFARFDPIAWRPEVLARRQMNWLYHAKLILDPEDLVYRSAVMNTLARQARHLTRVGPSATPGRPRMTAAVGLVFSSLSLPYSARRFQAGLDFLTREVRAQIHADGGYLTRNPVDQFAVLRELSALKKLFLTAGREVPAMLQQAIDRMAPMARALLHGDGGLALMNGANEGDPEEWRRILTLSESQGKPIADASHTGYQRAQAGQTLLIIDAGKPPSRELQETTSHAAPLAFEMSVGDRRIIVNCGHGVEGGEWVRASRNTAAHSTLVLGERNAVGILANGRLGRRPETVKCERQEAEGQVWLDMRHDGYRKLFAIEHHRRLYLSGEGGDLRGEDELIGPGLLRHQGLSYALRFHLHPGIPASLLGGGDSVVLRVGRSEAWRFTAKGGRVTLEDSIYLGTGTPRKTEQIVVTCEIGDTKPQIKWSLKRLEALKGGG
jgi:uncharacterized heparinase superfamily protein